ncbi:MAG: YebC/PmpR family DNA-binding transcriptional regulator [Pseudomonas sp.]|jgi:YebC/PmpR family DNA-binding regulatory protein|uniref:YebC/PmpR family DNA-binding transcriptional regulator n=1 Tax=Stutzerimonas frequens TaxID=2968969 RepID=UPI000C5F98EE|nr:YebC/PmpR family DNA-binding transcriptional regulator [Stutzerimonas frequens]MAL91820.1 YebC/PmpR family DNA-binding transcriptional regulator [Pseudomonas sp.]NCT79904.1 YebC/PmpR family DNA-binding transcriptional regulator [Stutzerimonas stutzeri]MBA4727647.1 YebC/PmpR family DNA-binding transcriptional regulator [Pseudomonas sp.]MBK3916343.1 YebC/PmpR family DNA-binding transcriptional regulator [Stutzerimonas frequens]QFU13167.1 Transcriptional regulatory protein PmpR [Stutzerimonas |tara:strand:- start:15346 stop:16095 length:750 start_codon:yes stop_codon:yes gene_type:complete
MAGHSKWANIKHRKERQDAKRGKIFTKLIRELTVAAKHGGGVPADNPRLRLAVDKALTANMSRDVIDRAIARGAGSNEADNMTELSYEGYAPSGVAIIIEAMTDNRNRTAAEVRHAFSKNGGNLGTDGSVAYMFDRKGQISYAPDVDEDALMEAALEAGADDVVAQEDGSVEVYTSFSDFLSVNEALTEAGFKGDEAEVAMIPSITAPITDVETAQKVLRLIDALEDLDDVQNVYHNAEISDEIMQQLG